MVRRMWANRPNLLDLLFMAILVMTARLLTGIPVGVLAAVCGSVMVAVTAMIARRTPIIRVGRPPIEGKGVGRAT